MNLSRRRRWRRSGRLCHTALLHFRYADFWGVHQSVETERLGEGRIGAGRGAPWGCQLRGVEGWLRRVPWQKRERMKEIVKRSCSTALISKFGLITAALYKSFEISLFKQSADRCQCLFRTNLWLPLQKASESGGRQRQWHTSVRRLLGRHTSSWQMGCAAFKDALVHNFFFLPCNIHVWLSPVDFGKVKSQHCYGLIGESGAGSTDHTVSPLQQCYFFLSSKTDLIWFISCLGFKKYHYFFFAARII